MPAAMISESARQDTVRQILFQLQNITGRSDVETAARSLEAQVFQQSSSPEDYFQKIASRISVFSKRMARQPQAATQPAVCLPIQHQAAQPRPQYQQVAATSAQEPNFNHMANDMMNAGQQPRPYLVPATGMLQQVPQSQSFAPGMPRPVYVGNVQSKESYQVQQQPGLILSHDPNARMQQLQQRPDVIHTHPMMQRPGQMVMQQMPMGGRQHQQMSMFQPNVQGASMSRQQTLPNQHQMIPVQQQQQQQGNLPQQPQVGADAAEQYWGLQQRMRSAYLQGLLDLQKMQASHQHGSQAAMKMEKLLKATLPHLALDRNDQAAQGKTAVPADLHNLRNVERLYGPYLQTLASRSQRMRPQAAAAATTTAATTASEGFPASQMTNLTPQQQLQQQLPAQSAASSRAPTPQPMEMPTQSGVPQPATPAESMGEAPGKPAREVADLDAPESAKPNAVAAALDASELVMDLSADFDYTDDFLGLFPPTPKPAGAMAAVASDISRMLWQNDTDLPMPPKDFSASLEDWMCPDSAKSMRVSTPISSAFIEGFLQDLPTSTELSSSTDLDPVCVLGQKRKSGGLDEASSDLSGAKKQCRDHLEREMHSCRNRMSRIVEVAVTGTQDYGGAVSVECRVEPILPGMDPSASRITNRQGGLVPETWMSLTMRIDEHYPEEPPVVIFNSLKGSFAPQADAARSVFETAISVTRSPLTLDVITSNWQKSVASVVKVFSRTAGAA